ncbi:MAG: AI-2E family transporter [Thermoguttaceae bacterium]
MTSQPAPAVLRSFTYRMVLGTAIVLGMIVLSVFIWYALNVLMLIFAGLLLAILLRSLADWLSLYTRLPGTWSLIVALLLLVLGIGGIGWLLAPRVASQVEELAVTIPQSLQQIQSNLEQQDWGRWLIRALNVENVRQTAPQILVRATGWLYTGVGAIFSLVIILFIGIYLAIDPLLYTAGILRLVPAAYRPRAQEVLGSLVYTLRWWLFGQLAAMSVVGTMTAIGLWLLGVPLALTLGLLLFLLDFVPFFGPVIAAIPGVLLALAESPAKGIYVILLYIGVQQVESMLVVPLIQKRTVLLPPVLTMVSQVLVGIFAGPLGFILATPLMAATLVLVKMLYVEDLLGEEVETPEDHLSSDQLPPIPDTQPTDEQRAATTHDDGTPAATVRKD